MLMFYKRDYVCNIKHKKKNAFQCSEAANVYLQFTFDINIFIFSVSAHVDGQPAEQGRPVAGLHSHREKCLDRNQPTNPHPKNFPSLLWPHG